MIEEESVLHKAVDRAVRLGQISYDGALEAHRKLDQIFNKLKEVENDQGTETHGA